jgi:hypothetical protein
MAYPFQLAKPGGFVNGDTPTHTELNAMDQNGAAGADGGLWTDLAMFRNWQPVQSVAGFGASVVWSKAQSRWHTFGVSGGNPVAKWSPSGGTAWVSNNPAANDGLTPRRLAVASDGAGKVLMGGLPGVASAYKIRSLAETVLGGTWTSVRVVDATTAAANCLAYWPELGLWIVGLSNGNVETSTTAADLSWTNRTVPNANARAQIALSPTRAVITAAASTNKAISSTDGVNWTEVTLPSSTSWLSVAYNAVRQRFIAIAAAAIAQSSDGVTWSTSGVALPTSASPETIVAMGRLWAMHGNTGDGTHHGVWVSSDNGATWQLVRNATQASVVMATSGYQLLWTNNSGTDHHLSLGGGF